MQLRFVIVSLLALVLVLISNQAWSQPNETILHAFGAKNDGFQPSSALAADTAGNLYGTTSLGGTGGSGVIYMLTPNSNGGWDETVIHSFGPGEGGSLAALALDAAGNLYGTTYYGGSYNNGTVFEVARSQDGNWTYNILYSFTGGADGADPQSTLTFDGAGNLYGSAAGGLKNAVCLYGCGVIFELSPVGGQWHERVLYSFRGGRDGLLPNGKLLLDSKGNLYGTTEQGGRLGACSPLGCGVVFELSPSSEGEWNETILHAFTGRADGAGPDNIIFDRDGNLYGATSYGGNIQVCVPYPGCGVIFELSPSSNGTWTQTVLHTFNGKDGSGPGDLILDVMGNLYGTTWTGGPGDGGVIFRLSRDSNGTWTENAIHTFSNAGFNGSFPYGPLLLDASGNLLGTTGSGGPFGGDGGLVYRMSPQP